MAEAGTLGNLESLLGFAELLQAQLLHWSQGL